MQSNAQAPIGAKRPAVALCRPRIVPDPVCKVSNWSVVRLWQKMRGGTSIVNGALRLALCFKANRIATLAF
jgi:hypothetical protein